MGVIIAVAVAATIIAVSVVLTRSQTVSQSNTPTITTTTAATVTATLSGTITTTTKLTGTAMSTTAVTSITANMMSSTSTATTTFNPQCRFGSRVIYSTSIAYRPSSIVAADVNNDQKPDIIIGNNGVDSVLVALNGGDGTFNKQRLYSTGIGSAPRSVAAGDVNGDGTLDIIVANFGTNNVGVLLNTVNAIFADQITYSTGLYSTPYSVTTADINGDNHLDIIVANYGANNIGVLLNMGNGTFFNQTAYSSGDNSNPKSVTTGDVNGDGKIDIIVANEGTENINVFMNIGNGQFTNPIIYSTDIGSYPQCVATDDLNGDNKLDIIVADEGLGNIGIIFNQGDGTFSSQITYPVSPGPISVATDDVNDDNKTDIIIVDFTYGIVIVLLNTDNETFSQQTDYRPLYAQGLRAVVTADVDGDNKSDIITADRLANNFVVLFNTGNGKFTDGTTYPTVNNPLPYSILTADVNGDNTLDIVVANSGQDNVGVLFNMDNIKFTSETIYWTGYGSSPHSVVSADINGDSKLDIIVANYGTDNVGILLNIGNGIFSSQTIYSTGLASGPQSIVVADVNNDNRLDIIVANSRANNIGVFLNIANRSYTNLTTYSTFSGSNSYSVTTADVNGDNKLDIIVANQGLGNIGIFLNNGNGIFGRQTTYSTGSNSQPNFVMTANINGDNHPDIIVANSAANTIGVFLGMNNGTFSIQTIYSTGDYSKPRSFTIADMDGDNKLDIIVANFDTDNVNVLLNVGDGTFMNSEMDYSIPSGSGPQSVAVGDIDGDKKLDIILANYGANNIHLLINTISGMFNSQTSYSTGVGSYPSMLYPGDINGDNKLDILVECGYDINCGFLINAGNGTFTIQDTNFLVPIEYSGRVVLADVNGDNKLDTIYVNSYSYPNDIYVFLNTGNGTFDEQMKYSASFDSTPFSVSVADVNGDNKPDIITQNSDTSSVDILLNIGNGTFSDPMNYSTGIGSQPVYAEVVDVNGDNQLDIITISGFSISNVSVLLNIGDGMFDDPVIYPTYSSPQPMSMVTGDLNNDNKLDIIVANFASANVGVFLNFGNGTFTNQITYSTGVLSRPNQVIVADVNGDNRLDIIVTNYDANNVGVFLNVGNGVFSSQTIYLTGPASSPPAIAVTDVNNDNKPDIIALNMGTNNVGVFLNIGNGIFNDPMIYSLGSGSSPMSMLVIDVNDDGKPDIISANFYGDNVGVLLAC